MTECEAADCAPNVYGHKCYLPKGHGRKVEHCCACGHTWPEPSEPDTTNVRTVPGQLAL